MRSTSTMARRKPAASAALDAMILEVLAIRKRVELAKLAFYATHRLGKRDVKVSRTAAGRAVKSLITRGVIEMTESRGKSMCALANTRETRAVVATHAKQARRRAAVRRANAPLPKTRCYILGTRAPLYPRLAAAIRARFTVVEETPSAIAFRWTHRLGEGPVFRVEPTMRAEVRRAMGGGRYSFRKAKQFVDFAVLSFTDLDEVLDETNSLIEAQGVLAAAAPGPLYNAWNHSWIEL